jgi:cell division protein FtsL
MLKLILCLVCAVALAVVLLQLRQQRLELNHQANRLHNQIDAQQAKLWGQQLDIALYTAPNAISKTVENKAIHLVPQSPQHVGSTSWIQSQ